LWSLTGSCRSNGEDFPDLRRYLASFDALGENAQTKRFYASDSFIARSAVGHGAGNLGSLGNPPAILFLLGLYRECHESMME